ncbi:hypothetical protein CVT26_001081 [Gymnopilus dilepis]|uniref:Tc1-like transposase DDE domain-containing protein n=1 Tax=Gymnopilus dilepis TaxID=231916 RepID=A0A409YN08_9AGAR|nr:hypothetical protein CVT26_001081 [Gymnopilus dilepis]
MYIRKTTRRQLDSPTKNRIVGFWKATGNAAAAARSENVRTRTAQRIIERWQKTGSTSNKPRPGRPSKLTDRDKREIVRAVRKNRRAPLTDITNQISADVSVSTVQRVLAAQGYHRRVARKVPWLTKNHRKLRFIWGKVYRKMRMRDWWNVIYSDETYIWVGDRAGRIFVTRRRDERLLDECLVPTFKQSNLRVMVWGCIVGGRKGPLVVMEYPGGKGGGMNTERYREQVLEGALLDFYNQLKVRKRCIRFQQDGASCHRSKATMNWLTGHRIPTLFHPPNSPDLTPIEPVWLELKRILRNRGHTPTSIDELKSAVREAWDQIPVEFINKHIKRMPDRVKAILKARGGHTQF